MPISAEQRAWLALTLVPGVGTTHFIRLLARFRTPGAVLSAGEGQLREVVGPKLAQRIAQYGDAADVADQERRMAEYDAWLVTLNDDDYPSRLGEIYDPPLVLFGRGTLLPSDSACVAIVGTRRPTPYGVRMASRLAASLAERGITVVSGLAAGIDAAAHQGALEAGGRTIAILGNGVDTVYPSNHGDLMHRIIQQGCVLSQFSMGTKPSRGHFPYRNRIISGVTLGTIVVQAPLKSGALITARQAIEQGREVFAVPGEIGQMESGGPHALIQDGAKLVQTVDDILEELNLPEGTVASPERPAIPAPTTAPEPARPSEVPQAAARTETAPPPQPAKPAPQPTDIESRVLNALSSGGSYVDEIAARCKLSIAEALSSLTLLELKGLVRQFSGKRFAPR